MPRVLVVEAYAPLAKVIAIGLRRLGYEVQRAKSGQSARESEGDFEVALLDLDLPDGSGLALAQELLESRCAATVVFFSNNREPEVIAAARRLGAVVAKADGVDLAILAVSDAMKEQEVLPRVVGLPDTESTTSNGKSNRAHSGTRRRIR